MIRIRLPPWSEALSGIEWISVEGKDRWGMSPSLGIPLLICQRQHGVIGAADDVDDARLDRTQRRCRCSRLAPVQSQGLRFGFQGLGFGRWRSRPSVQMREED
jgi:hypothetical protein